FFHDQPEVFGWVGKNPDVIKWGTIDYQDVRKRTFSNNPETSFHTDEPRCHGGGAGEYFCARKHLSANVEFLILPLMRLAEQIGPESDSDASIPQNRETLDARSSYSVDLGNGRCGQTECRTVLGQRFVCYKSRN